MLGGRNKGLRGRPIVRVPREEYAERDYMFRAAAFLGAFLILTLVVTVGITAYLTTVKPGSSGRSH